MIVIIWNKMCWNLSDHQLKIDFYKYIGIYEAHGNHNPKLYKRHTRNKEKGIQTHHYKVNNIQDSKRIRKEQRPPG